MRCSSNWKRALNSIAAAGLVIATAHAQSTRTPTARLVSASRLNLPAEIDSSNPAAWALVDGTLRLFVISDVFWGPSIHWNTYLEKYVMLLNRAKDDVFGQDGIYVSFSSTLQPSDWSAPVKILNGGTWYPQVIGGEPGTGTDRRAGQRARFFMMGRSERMIEFQR